MTETTDPKRLHKYDVCCQSCHTFFPPDESDMARWHQGFSPVRCGNCKVTQNMHKDAVPTNCRDCPKFAMDEYKTLCRGVDARHSRRIGVYILGRRPPDTVEPPDWCPIIVQNMRKEK